MILQSLLEVMGTNVERPARGRCDAELYMNRLVRVLQSLFRQNELAARGHKVESPA
jgi:hypothetical protein